jgi:hypothetical protein
MPTLRLPVQLNDQEKLVVSGDLSAAITALEEVEAEKKEITKGFNERIKEFKTSVHTLNVSLVTGTCEREVEIEEWEDLDTGLVKTKRLDTGEIIKTRPLDPEERQLKIGIGLGDIQAHLAGLDKTEEQLAAMTPEEAEQMRAERLADEAADRGEEPAMPSAGDTVEVFPSGATDWAPAAVLSATDHDFFADIDGQELVFDVVNYGKSWRHPPTWSDVKAASEERARQEEIQRLAAEQAADGAPKRLLKAPKKNGKTSKRIRVEDEKGNELPPPPPPAPPADDDDIAF